MKRSNLVSILESLDKLGIHNLKGVFWNLNQSELIEEAIKRSEGVLTDTGALMADTGKFTGRSPKDQFIVKDDVTQDKVWWGDINIPFDAEKFNRNFEEFAKYANDEIKAGAPKVMAKV